MSGLAHAAGWCEDDTSRNVRSEVSRVLVCGLSHRDEGVVAEEDVDEVLSCPLNR